jgi:regulator of replication initiation timing
MINLISRDPISPEEKVKNIVAMYTDEISIFGKISGRIEKLVNQLHHQLKSEKTIVKSLIKYSESERVKARELRIKYLVKTIKREHKHILNININLNILIEELKKHVQELSNENKIPDNEKDITENFVEKINSIGKKGYEVLQRIYSYHKDAKKYLKNLSEGDVFN